MRCLYWAIALLILLPTAQYGHSSLISQEGTASDHSLMERMSKETGVSIGEGPSSLMIFAIMPSFPSESVTIFNPSDLAVSLRGWSLSG